MRVTPSPARLAARAGLLFAFWLLLSGGLDAFHLLVGAGAAAAVAALQPILVPPDAGERAFSWLRFASYAPWLLSRVALSAWHVSRVALHPKLAVAPRLFRQESRLGTDLELAAYGNSITLTPGTLTVDAEDGVLTVHCLDDESAGDVESRLMESKVGRVFGRSLEPG